MIEHKMTYKEAADRLEEHKDWGWNGLTTRAIDMAIELLRKESAERGEDDDK